MIPELHLKFVYTLTFAFAPKIVRQDAASASRLTKSPRKKRKKERRKKDICAFAIEIVILNYIKPQQNTFRQNKSQNPQNVQIVYQFPKPRV